MFLSLNHYVSYGEKSAAYKSARDSRHAKHTADSLATRQKGASSRGRHSQCAIAVEATYP